MAGRKLANDLDIGEAAKLLKVVPVGTIGALVRAATVGVRSRDDILRTLERLAGESPLLIKRFLIERATKAVRDAGD